VFLVIGFTSSAQAVIKIEIATMQNGMALIQGNGAVLGAQIFWEGSAITTANRNNGGFSFFGIVPNDCVGSLSDQPGGASPINVQLVGCTPVSAAAPAPVPRTGQTTSYAPGDDGALQKGVVLPTPRLTDNNNGTITDNLTGLIWLKNANCIGSSYPGFDQVGTVGDGAVNWNPALDFVAGINAGTYNCGDNSNAGNHQTDWRLPNIRELNSLIDFGRSLPALPADHPFSNFQVSVNDYYWSSTSVANLLGNAWMINFYLGNSALDNYVVAGSGGIGGSHFVIAVRGG